jgi:hypothetical protein
VLAVLQLVAAPIQCFLLFLCWLQDLQAIKQQAALSKLSWHHMAALQLLKPHEARLLLHTMAAPTNSMCRVYSSPESGGGAQQKVLDTINKNSNLASDPPPTPPKICDLGLENCIYDTLQLY